MRIELLDEPITGRFKSGDLVWAHFYGNSRVRDGWWPAVIVDGPFNYWRIAMYKVETPNLPATPDGLPWAALEWMLLPRYHGDVKPSQSLRQLYQDSMA